MEQMESFQKVNQQYRLVKWSHRMETCRNSGLTVGQWCQENRIAVSSYFLLAEEGVSGSERSPGGNLCRGACYGVFPALWAYL